MTVPAPDHVLIFWGLLALALALVGLALRPLRPRRGPHDPHD